MHQSISLESESLSTHLHSETIEYPNGRVELGRLRADVGKFIDESQRK